MAVAMQQRQTDLEQVAVLAGSSCASSARLLRRLSLVGASQVLAARGALPPAAFRPQRPVRGRRLPLLQPLPGPAARLHRSLHAALRAVDKAYLRQMVLCFYDNKDDPESLIESYTFKYKYNQSGMTLEQTLKGKRTARDLTVSSENIIASTIQLLDYCSIFCDTKLESLPDEFDVAINLFYYDDVTPPDYEPEGFSPSFVSPEIFERQKPYILVGKVLTPHHKFLMGLYCRDKPIENTPTRPPDAVRESSQNSQKSIAYDVSKSCSGTTDEEIVDEEMPKKENKSPVEENCSQSANHPFFESMESNLPEPKSPLLNTEATSDNDIRCPCATFNEYDQFMLKCSNCNTWQHSACFGLLENVAKVVTEHCCDVCAVENPKLICTDPNLLKLDSRLKTDLSLFRIAVAYCLDCHQVDLSTFVTAFGIKKNKAIEIMSKLERSHVFYPLSSTKHMRLSQIRIVNLHILKSVVIPKYFCTSYVEKNEVTQSMENLSVSIPKVVQRKDSSTEKLASNATSIKRKNSNRSMESENLDSTPTNSAVRKSERLIKHRVSYRELDDSPPRHSKKIKLSSTSLKMKRGM